MKKNIFKYCVIAACLFIVESTIAQSLSHPRIWVKDTDKQNILDKIAQVSWAQNLYNQYVNRNSSLKNSHGSSPQTIINTIPGFPGNRTTHRDVLTKGFESALLYWLTGDDAYGQIAADILYHYTKEISKISGNVNFHSGDYLIDSREAYTKPPMIYDFVYGFLKKSGTTVYDKDSGLRVPFNFTKAETTFKKLADNVYGRGGLNSNHPVLEAPAALFNSLAIDNDATRNTYFNKFMNGTNKQNGLTWMMNECKESGIWPESTGYSLGPQRIILELMEVADKYKPSLNIIDNNKDILESCFLFENMRFPNGSEVMRFGDAHRTRLNTQALMERVIVISTRKGYTNFKDKSEALLKAIYNSKSNGYNPSVSTQSLEWNNPLQLLYNIDVDLNNISPITYNRSLTIDHAGLVMQRNINTSNEVESSLMGYTGGAHYVHSHLSGIDMEIYGVGAVLGTGGGDVGASARNGAEFRNYHRIYAGHNTVIVNGKSKGRGVGSWKSDNQLYMNKTATVAAEPQSLKDAISNDFSFSTQVLNDAVNNAKQQRVFSIVRTSDNTGYYFDLFRSKSLGTNNYHDYVYHNVGDGITMVDENKNPLLLTSKPNRYPSVESVYNNKSIFFPGWHYFEDINTSTAISTGVKATIPMTKQGTRYMHVLMPGGENREYTACKGPATIEAQMGYDGIKTPVLTVRHLGEAWDKPFISIFEPSRNSNGAVQSVENLYTGDKIVGAKVVSLVNGNTITDYIISHENDNETYASTSLDMSFTGRFAIIRKEEKTGDTNISLYIGKGQKLTFKGKTLDADSSGKAYLKYMDGPKEFAASIISPSNNQSFEEGANVELHAYATTDTGEITKAEFYINGSLYQEDNSYPYLVNWIPADVGSYTIKTKVYNSGGNSIESSEVTISVTQVDKTDLTGDIYVLKNVETGQYLQAQSTSASPLLMSASGEGQDNEWSFVATIVNNETLYNIDSEVVGILRATGGNFTVPYAAVNTTKASPASDSDKIWTVHYDESDDTYRFEANKGGRFLYHDADGSVNTNIVSDTDKRSKWKVISTSSLSVHNEGVQLNSIKAYPNPTSGEFHITVPSYLSNIKLEVYNIQGQRLSSTIQKVNNGRVSLDLGTSEKGIYFVKVNVEKPVFVKVIKN
ncbi:Ig-like domain-containing protein [Bacteroidota bacterium]